MAVFVYVVFHGLFVGSVFFFFFKQKTAYEMRISDWSSDVCSSDLVDCANGSSDRMRRRISGSRIFATRFSKGRCASSRYVGVPENGFCVPSSPNRLPIGRGATTVRIGRPSAAASRASSITRPQDRKSKRLNQVTNAPLVSRLL